VVAWRFVETELWREAVRQGGVLCDTGDTVFADDLLDELKLKPGLYHRARAQLVRRLSMVLSGEREPASLDPDGLVDAIIGFRRKYWLLSHKDVDRWLRDSDLTTGDLVSVIEAEARLQAIVGDVDLVLDTDALLLNALRASDSYQRLLERAARLGDRRGHRGRRVQRQGLKAPRSSGRARRT
jgi:hypothetical protein